MEGPARRRPSAKLGARGRICTYGIFEVCGRPIAEARLQARRPRASAWRTTPASSTRFARSTQHRNAEPDIVGVVGDRRLSVTALALGGLCLLVGLVWTLQGAGVLAGSFMTGSRLWLAIGIILDLAGVYLMFRGIARQPRSR